MNLYERPIAHKGIHGGDVSENSMTAFKRAVEGGFNMEIDVHVTKDNRIVIMHDFDTLAMTKKKKKIKKLTTKDVESGDYLLPCGERIPFLDDLIKYTDGKSHILVELKTLSFFNRKLEKTVLNLIKGKEDWITVQSFNPMSVVWFRKHAPEFSRGQLANYQPNQFLRVIFFRFPLFMLRFTKPEFFAYRIEDLPDEKTVAHIRKKGLKLITWTVRTQKQLETSFSSVADNFIFENIEVENSILKGEKL